MNEKLIVKDFGPIKNAELDLKKVTIFIGPQGSGKSALAKLVAICKDSDFLAMCYVGASKETIFDFFKKYDAQYFLEDVTLDYETLDYDFRFKSYNASGYFDFKKPVSRSYFIGENPTFSNFESYEKFLKSEPFINDSDLIPLKKCFSDIAKNHVKYIPTERLMLSYVSDSLLSLLSADVALTKGFIDFGRDFEIARKSQNWIDIDFLGIRYIYQDNRNYVIHHKSGAHIPLSASSSGQQSVVPLYAVVEHFTKKLNATTIVEEPELNLFPNAQKELVSYLVNKGIQGENQLLMTTHSPYVLSAINNLIFAYKVAHEIPEKAEDVAQIIPREQWLNPEDVAAYYVADGTVKSIIAEKHGLIGENELDAISEDISGERDQLFKILRSKKRETVN
jgi:predicted ATPase